MMILRPCALLQTSAERARVIFLFLRRRFHLLLFSPKAKCAASDRKGQRASGHTWFVPSRAKHSSVTSASDLSVASTNLKRDTGNTKDSLCNWIQLNGVNILFVSSECRN